MATLFTLLGRQKYAYINGRSRKRIPEPWQDKKREGERERGVTLEPKYLRS